MCNWMVIANEWNNTGIACGVTYVFALPYLALHFWNHERAAKLSEVIENLFWTFTSEQLVRG